MISLLRKLKSVMKYRTSLLLKKDFAEFHAFPFDTLNKMPDGAEDVMKIFCGILNELAVDYRLADGTILGIYRDGGFIPHDNDIDVEVLGSEKLDSIIEAFFEQGMTLGRKVVYKGKIQQLVFYTSDHIIFDIVVWHDDGESKIYNYSERDYERVQDNKYFKPGDLADIQFKGNSYPIPTPIEPWLEMRYGSDWGTPKTYKGDWKEECFDMSKMS